MTAPLPAILATVLTVLAEAPASPPKAAPPVCFPGAEWLIEGGAEGLAVADLNGDGKPEVLTRSPRTGAITVLEGTGTATFTRSRTTPAPKASGPFALADLNGDSKLDLVLTGGPDTVAILLARADGTWSPPRDVPIAGEALDLAVADVNRDGRADLVLATRRDRVSVLLGRADGSWSAPLDTVTGRNPTHLAVADLDGDGLPDLAVNATGSEDHFVSVFRGKGDGTFGARQDLPFRGSPGALLLADLDGDGQRDLAALDWQRGTVVLFHNAGKGQLQPTGELGGGFRPEGLLLRDMNGDGLADLVVVNEQNGRGGRVAIYRGLEGGKFEPKSIDIETLSGPRALAVADLDGDGSPELIVTDGQFVSAHRGPFSAARPSLSFPAGEAATGLAVADFDGDGKADLATVNPAGASALLLRGKGDGSFMKPASLPTWIPSKALPPDQIEEASSGVGGYGAAMLLNQPVALAAGPLEGKGPWGLAVLNGALGDGLDASKLLREQASSGQPLVGRPNLDSVSVFRARPGGPGPRVDVPVGKGPTALAVGDLDRDGRADVAVASPETSSVSVLYSLGQGRFRPRSKLAVPKPPSALAIADVNRDGLADLAVLSQEGATLQVFLNTRSRGFTPAAAAPVPAGAMAFTVSDLDGDGIADIALQAQAQPEAGEETVTILKGKGDGTFSPLSTIRLPQNQVMEIFKPRGGDLLLAADFNADGVPDLAVVQWNWGRVTLLHGQGGGAFAAPVSWTAGPHVSAIAAGDFNGDGRSDLAAVASSGGREGATLHILLNACH